MSEADGTGLPRRRGLLWVGPLAAIVGTRWFVRRRGLVTGLMTASNATGQLVFLPALAAITTMFDRAESTGWRSPFSSGKNFWIVVKTIPPDATESFARRSSRSPACTGG